MILILTAVTLLAYVLGSRRNKKDSLAFVLESLEPSSHKMRPQQPPLSAVPASLTARKDEGALDTVLELTLHAQSHRQIRINLRAELSGKESVDYVKSIARSFTRERRFH